MRTAYASLAYVPSQARGADKGRSSQQAVLGDVTVHIHGDPALQEGLMQVDLRYGAAAPHFGVGHDLAGRALLVRNLDGSCSLTQVPSFEVDKFAESGTLSF